MVGAGLVVLAALFLTATAIDRGWIGPRVQLAGATAIGAALLAGAVFIADETRALTRLSSRRFDWARTLGAAGAVVLTACAGAAHAWLDLVSSTTALGLVTVAGAVSVAAAARIRSETVAVAGVLALLVVPAFAELVVDAPVAVVGIWVGAFAIVATAAGRMLGWPIFRLVSGWASAVWVLGLAVGLRIDDNAGHALAGVALVAVVALTLWIGPSPLGPGGSTVAGPGRPAVRLAELRVPTLLATWTWLAVMWFSGFDFSTDGPLLGLALAVGFALAAGAAWMLERRAGVRLLPEGAYSAHIMGAGLLMTVAVVTGFDGPLLAVLLAAQALATVVIGARSGDGPLRINGLMLAVLAWVLVAIDVIDILVGSNGSGVMAVDHLTRGLAVVALTGVAAVIDGRLVPWSRAGAVNGGPIGPAAEVANTVAFVAVSGFALSLVEPWLMGRTPLAAATAIVVVALAAAGWLGRGVQGFGVVVGVLTVIATAVALMQSVLTEVDTEVVDHLSTLAVVLGAGAMTATGRFNRRFGPWPSDLVALGFVVTWLLGLGWLASIFIDVPQGQAWISGSWAAAAVAAVVAGVALGRDRLAGTIRGTGLATLGAVVIKLLTVDLAEVDTLWRVGLFLVVGLGLLRLAYVLTDDDRSEAGSPPRG